MPIPQQMGRPKPASKFRQLTASQEDRLAQLVAISGLADSARNASAGPGSHQWRSLGDKERIQGLKDEPEKEGVRLRQGHRWYVWTPTWTLAAC